MGLVEITPAVGQPVTRNELAEQLSISRYYILERRPQPKLGRWLAVYDSGYR